MIRRFFSYYKPHRRLFIIDFTSAVIVALLELVFPVAVNRFIDDLLPGGNWNIILVVGILLLRSEERRVGKECRVQMAWWQRRKRNENRRREESGHESA